ncbi:MarR family transcriptional regulator (plasmid) [Apilactobacillus apisilvae]|uniref:MarR family transcriptional regulator n=1 Tax=Apilactobacillus apisilvae TaxID=2923364 RepID=A0ABY4PK60_9LACO|nr:MarR family transcriptional regulator [Apilactobacillus apisilvae]UQS85832.1 MarR family transcriptional regulator [Apilactobacillus apisilvae]
MNSQFIKNYTEFEKAGFRPTEVSILSHLYDYGNLSVKNGWIEDGVVFVKYLRSSLASKINVSVDTITRSLKVIEDRGWIKVKRQKNAASIYYLPKYNDVNSGLDTQNASTENANCNMNQTKFKQSYTNETNVTCKSSKNEQIAMSKTEVGTEENKTIHVSGLDRMQNLVNSLKQKACFGHDLINILVKYSENTGVLYNYAKLIFKAKKTVIAKLVKNGKPEAKEALRFENNISLMPELTEFMKSLIIKTRCTKYIKNVAGYITKSLHEFFTDAVGGYMSIERQAELYKNTRGFNIPIIKLDK